VTVSGNATNSALRKDAQSFALEMRRRAQDRAKDFHDSGFRNSRHWLVFLLLRP
jgi:hypothetical protein